MFVAIIICACFFGLILPAISKRTWTPPNPTNLISASGHFVRQISPYPYSYEFLGDQSGKIFLRCQPYIRKYNSCLSSIPPNILYNNKSIYKIKFFYARDFYDSVPIIMDLNIDGNNYINYNQQINWLNTIISQQDSGNTLAIPSIILALFIISVTLFAFFAKFSRSN
jgi:hypothetical protein